MRTKCEIRSHKHVLFGAVHKHHRFKTSNFWPTPSQQISFLYTLWQLPLSFSLLFSATSWVVMMMGNAAFGTERPKECSIFFHHHGPKSAPKQPKSSQNSKKLSKLPDFIKNGLYFPSVYPKIVFMDRPLYLFLFFNYIWLGMENAAFVIFDNFCLFLMIFEIARPFLIRLFGQPPLSFPLLFSATSWAVMVMGNAAFGTGRPQEYSISLYHHWPKNDPKQPRIAKIVKNYQNYQISSKNSTFPKYGQKLSKLTLHFLSFFDNILLF